MQLVFIFIIGLIALSIFYILIGIFRTMQVQMSVDQKKFLDGKIPHPLPDGFYRGYAKGYTGPWIGKTFHQKTQTGVNVFTIGTKREEKFPFITNVGMGIHDKTHPVLRIDYNHKKNSFFLRMVLDELVEYEQGKFIGKIHLRIIPHLTFTLGHFFLEKMPLNEYNV